MQVEPVMHRDENAIMDVLSLGGNLWQWRSADDFLVRTFMQKLSIPEIIARILVGRGIGLDEMQHCLAPSVKDLLPDPNTFLGMKEAIVRLVEAIKHKQTIAVFGDYDVDGATSTALIMRFLADVGSKAGRYIPDRSKEGYGPSIAAFNQLKESGVDLVITVDCGTTAFEPLAHAKAIGLDVIVLDHHAGEPELPASVAVVNPNRIDESSDYTYLAAVGVTFVALVALNRALREAGWYKDRPEPNLLALLDLVALGTVCDVVPLKGLNRAFVRQGLKVMRKQQNIGLSALFDAAQVRRPPDSYVLGFMLGPRVNAGGRVGLSTLGTDLLTTSDSNKAREIAQKLDLYNQERRAIEDLVLTEALEQVEALEELPKMLVVSGEGWHPGVIGIVAGRLKERYKRPAWVIAMDGDAGKGSGRSVEGIDLGAMVIAARQAGMLVSGGGHKMAAGLSVQRDKLDGLADYFNQRLQQELPLPSLKIDGALTLASLNLEFLEQVNTAGPYGAGYSQPRFLFKGLRAGKAMPLGSKGLRCIFYQDGREDRNDRVQGLIFRGSEGVLGDALKQAKGRLLDIVGTLSHDSYKDEVQIMIDDIYIK